MKKLLTSLALIFTLNACSVTEFFNIPDAQDKFRDLCRHSSELAICGERKIPEYNNSYYAELWILNNSTPFEYKADGVKDIFTYLTGPIHKGDCEDWSITFIEDNLRAGNFAHGTVELVIGKLNGVGHAWTIVTIDDTVRLFDNGFTTGISWDNAYEYGYREESIVYKY